MLIYYFRVNFHCYMKLYNLWSYLVFVFSTVVFYSLIFMIGCIYITPISVNWLWIQVIRNKYFCLFCIESNTS